jgi:hypothetical protein
MLLFQEACLFHKHDFLLQVLKTCPEKLDFSHYPRNSFEVGRYGGGGRLRLYFFVKVIRVKFLI